MKKIIYDDYDEQDYDVCCSHRVSKKDDETRTLNDKYIKYLNDVYEWCEQNNKSPEIYHEKKETLAKQIATKHGIGKKDCIHYELNMMLLWNIIKGTKYEMDIGYRGRIKAWKNTKYYKTYTGRKVWGCYYEYKVGYYEKA